MQMNYTSALLESHFVASHCCFAGLKPKYVIFTKEVVSLHFRCIAVCVAATQLKIQYIFFPQLAFRRLDTSYGGDRAE